MSPRPDPNYVMTYAAIADARDREQVVDGRQQSHDTLLRLTGKARRSGVSWRQVPAHLGVKELDRLIAGAYRIDGEDRATAHEDLRQFLLKHPAGALIVAMAEVDDPDAP